MESPLRVYHDSVPAFLLPFRRRIYVDLCVAAAPEVLRRVVRPRRRYIDPLVAHQGRLSEANAAFHTEVSDVLAVSQEHRLCAR